MLNITSLSKHIDEIRVILADECLDILALNETRLDNTINNQVMCISNYDLIRVDRSRTGGGVCLFVKTSLNYLEQKDLTRDNLEAVCVEIHKSSTSSNVMVASTASGDVMFIYLCFVTSPISFSVFVYLCFVTSPIPFSVFCDVTYIFFLCLFTYVL